MRKIQSSKNYSNEGHYVCGRNAVREMLLHRPQNIEGILLTTVAKKEFEDEGISFPHTPQLISGKELDDRLHTTSHQGVCLHMSDSAEITLEDLLDGQLGDDGVIVALDGIQDPHNLGAIFRAAECFGVKALLWSRNRTVAVTPAVTKVSVGATELVPFCIVGNLSQALQKLKENGVWILTAANGLYAKKPTEVDLPGPKCLVLGAEGDGVSHGINELADMEVFVPMVGKIDSLNVSQAAAVILSAITAK